MFKKPWGQSKVRLLLVDGDVASIEAARKALEHAESPFVVDAAFDGKVALEKLGSKQYDCLLVDADVLNRIGHNISEALAMAGSEAALVVLCHRHRPHLPPDLMNLAGITFLDKEALRSPNLAERVSECLDVAHAMRNGEVDALLVPIAGTASPLLAAGADSIYRVLVETLQEGILTIDSKSDILFTNRRTGEILGCDPDSLLGLDVLALVKPEERVWISTKIDEALRGTASRCEVGLACPGQAPVYVLVSLGLVEDMGGGASGVCLALTDLSEEKRLRDELQELATTDALTDLYNRRYLAESLENECRRASRYGRPLSCLMIDIDEFKLCNDLHGHLAGDDVLRQVAALIKGAVRDTDVVARYGGEEFCVLLPETSYDGAMQLAERMRSTIAGQPLSGRERPMSITVSIGVWGSNDKEDLEPDTIVGYADAALLKAKAAGKNRVCGHLSHPLGTADAEDSPTARKPPAAPTLWTKIE
jgi:diguanylate cyclase (GGDEF)-like protein/PAS domain S-box-containing protein